MAIAPDGRFFVCEQAGNLRVIENGQLLRINSDGTIPPDNPFAADLSAKGEIWALGLRNPFTFGIQPGTGRIFIDDVGQDTWEEIDDGVAGGNYGWPDTEGPTSDPR